MLQFDTFTNPHPRSRRHYPLVVCLQSALVDGRSNQVVVPLVPRDALAGTGSPIAPVVGIDEREYVALVPMLASVQTRELTDRVANLSRHRDELLGAVDLLFYGV
jgi:toxin CcdB